MPESRGLRLLLAACQQALRDARAGRIDIEGAVFELERLCAALQAKIDAGTA
jgi:hypothetical protein